MQNVGLSRGFGECQTACVVNGENHVVAGLIFHNYDPDSGVMEVSAAATSPLWPQRSVLKEAFGYIFDRAGCQMAVARCEQSNDRVRRLWKGFGAREHIIPRLRGRDAAEAILTLTDDAWSASKFMR